MNKKIGFIGCGNMAKAMIGGLIKSKMTSSDDILASDNNPLHLEEAQLKYHIHVTRDNIELARLADILILAVNPDVYPIVIKEIKDSIKEEVIIVTIAAGITLKTTEMMFEKKLKIVN